MAYNNQIKAYQQASHTTSEMQQVIMLYEGAINFIEQAKDAINNKDYQGRYNLINKAIAIVNGLNSCLEFNDKTDETAKALDLFYQNTNMRLLYINTNDSIKDCDIVISELTTMLNAWKDIASESDGSSSSKKESVKESSSDQETKTLQNIEINI